MYPSVTQILKPWLDFSNIPPTYLDAAADRGSRVHAACAGLTQGLWVTPEADCRGFVESYEIWLSRAVNEVIATEIELYDHDLGFYGHPDLICIIGQDVIIIDLKTPITVSKSWRLQLAAYHHLAQINDYRPTRTATLRLSRDGKPPLFNEYTSTLATDFAVFLNCFSAYKYFLGDKPND